MTTALVIVDNNVSAALYDLHVFACVMFLFALACFSRFERAFQSELTAWIAYALLFRLFQGVYSA